MAENVPASLAYIPEPAEARRFKLAPLICAGFAVIALFFGGFGTWSSFAELDSAALATRCRGGRIQPQDGQASGRRNCFGTIGE